MHQVVPFLFFITLLLCAPALAYDGERTYNQLTGTKNAELKRRYDICLDEMRKESLALLKVRLDIDTILRTFTQQIRVVRHKKRHLFLDVKRYLYSLRLNTEFIDGYMRNLREDAVYTSLDALIHKSRGRL